MACRSRSPVSQANIDEILRKPELRKEIGEHNFQLGREHFSYDLLETKLEKLFSF